MAEKPYTKRELDALFKGFFEKFSEFEKDMRESNSRIEVQTVTTNGRVKDLELGRARQEGFNRALSIFGAAAWAVCFAFTSWVALQVVETGKQVQVINAKLSAYDIQIK